MRNKQAINYYRTKRKIYKKCLKKISPELQERLKRHGMTRTSMNLMAFDLFEKGYNDVAHQLIMLK
ncbi:MAG: hypothetical protein GT601_18205 [Acidaminobacter sp.]|uniref:hypothetical protein n=1 Tax=Acidaminobacter sp. TaxID=1872102 RepID=UPI00138209A0|nr:hypothetical protein [Acidaminobacter sp.]MZQ99605.1 hypothetical protein [Acidaminobacter sp.]